jgi:localization factor PodJL
MASSPWSVKGVDADAREAAKQAARARGMTLGEWLNAVIQETGEDDDAKPHSPVMNGSSRASGRQDVARHDVQGLTQALESLSRRIEASETRASLAFGGFDRSVLELAAKVENAERGTGAASSRIGGLVEDLRATQDALAQRLRRLEQSDSSTKNLEALKSLEAALGSLADQVFKQDEALRKDAEASRARLDQSIQSFEDRFSHLTSRLDQSISAAVETADKAGLRAEGGVREISERVTRLDDRLSESIDAVSDLDKRLEALRSSESASDIRAMFESRFDRLTETLDSELAQSRRELSAELEKATREAGTTGLEEVETVVERLSSRLDQIEQRHARTVQTLGGEIAKWSGALDRRLGQVEARNESGADEVAFKAHTLALGQQIDSRLNDIEAREARVMDSVGKEIGRATERLDQKLGESERHTAAAIQSFGEQVSRMAERLKVAQKEALTQLETKLTQSNAASEGRVTEALEGITQRLASVESKSGAENPLLEESLSRMEQRLNLLEKRVSTAPVTSADRFSEPAPLEDAFAMPSARVNADQRSPSPSTQSPVPPPHLEAGWEDDALDPVDFDAGGAANDFDAADPFSSSEDAFIDDVGAPYEPEASPFDDPNGFEEEEPSMPPPVAQGNGQSKSGGNDYLTRARAAALASNDPAPKKKRGGPALGKPKAEKSSDRTGAAPKGRRALLKATTSPIAGRGPLLIAASVAGLLVIGAAATVFMRDPASPSTEFDMPQYAGDGLEMAQSPMGGEADLTETLGDAGGLPNLEPETTPDQPAAAQSAGSPNPQTAPATSPVSAQVASTAPAARATTTTPVATARQVQPVQAGTGRQAASIGSSIPQSSPGARVAAPVAEPALTLEVAAGRGDPIAQFLLGNAALERGDLALGAGMIRRAASAGLPPAQYRLGKLHERGEGVPRDANEARVWTERAAQGGNTKAMHDLAHLYAEGEGAPQSYATSVEWFRKAADAGLLDSQFNLGVLYEQGLGVTPNLNEALYWFEVSARAGDRDARTRADDLKARISPSEAEATVRRAAAFRPQAPNPRANGRFGPQPWDTAAGSAGMTSASTSDIRTAQQLLIGLGYDAGGIDGTMGTQTRAAIQAFERANAMPITGNVTPQLIQRLNAASSNARG